MIKTQHIEMLLAIERAGSIRAAARLLGRTQPAVTKALRQAEADLGAAIFTRAASGVVVTEDGAPILRRARVIRAELRKMAEEIAQLKGAGTGRISLVVSPFAAHRLVAPAIRRFRRRFPRVYVQISGRHEPTAFAPLRSGAADLVVGPAPQGRDAAGLAVEPLLEMPVAVITGRGSRWIGARRFSELAVADWILIGTRARLPSLEAQFADRGLPPPVPLVTSDSIVSALALVQDSDFVCTFPGLLLADTMAHWRVAGIDLEDPPPPTQVALTMVSDRPPTPALRHFCDCMKAVAPTRRDAS